MAVIALRSLAANASAAIFPAVGEDALAAVEDLALEPAIRMRPSPRHSNILLVAGKLREEDRPELHRLHDQLPHPRASVWWQAEPDSAFQDAIEVAAGEDPAPVVRAAYRQLMLGERESEPDILPDEPPAPWRGKGDHGQGGEGMMGGKPYGRPMAMTEDDIRDGLALDAYASRIGPFLPTWPPGLLLELTLQGDVIQSASVLRPPHPQGEGGDVPLRRIGRVLRLLGLEAQAQRFFRVARDREQGRRTELRSLRRSLAWSFALPAIPPRLGSTGAGDVRSRVRAWCEEATAEAEGSRPRPGSGAAPAEAGASESRLVELLPGLEWTETALVINSFTIPELRRMCLADLAAAEEDKEEDE